MASGAKVSDNVTKVWNCMKVLKSDADASERLRVLVIGFNDESTIDVIKRYTEKDLEGEDIFLFVKKLMEPKSCCYVVYDCHYETKESKREDLLFLSWSDDNGCIKGKMKYASSKDALKKILNGVKQSKQINDYQPIATRGAFAAFLGLDMISLEGVPLDCQE